MDHTKAVSDHSAERYLLGEMPAEEAEEFEHHYFECRECALAVESGQIFVANAREVLDDPEPAAERNAPPETERRSIWDAFMAWRTNPAFAFCLLAVVALGALSLYQGQIQMPRLRQALDEARVVPAFQLIPTSRGDASRVIVPRGTPFFSIAGDIPPDVHFAGYLCELSTSGRTIVSLHAPPPAVGQPISIQLSAKEVSPGSYELNVYGTDQEGHKADRISRFNFEVEFH
jgi:hypothetical protein